MHAGKWSNFSPRTTSSGRGGKLPTMSKDVWNILSEAQYQRQSGERYG